MKFKFKNWIIFLMCIGISFLFLMICSNNSFFYSFNDNQDINWYITMGNGLLENKIPYKDLYEQKGPIVYFVFSFFCMFSNPYRMAFIFEIICISIFLFFSYKIMIKFVSNKLSLFSIILVAFITLTSPYFVVGGGALEEYCLSVFSYMLYCFIEFIHDKKQFNFIRSMIWGILIGVLLLSKFTLLALPFIIFVYISFVLLKEKKIKNLINMILSFILGVLIVSLPIIIFFIEKNAFYDFVEVYFYNNLFKYKKSVNIGWNFYNICLLGVVPFSFMLFGLISYQAFHKIEKYKKAYLILFSSYFFILLVSGNFSYYYLPLCVFVPMGVMFILDFIIRKYPKINNKYLIYIMPAFLLISCLLFGNGTLEINKKKNDYIHFEIARDIKAINNENPTLFCYKLWDYGFYNVLGVTPNVKYYANNVFEEEDFPEMYEAFKTYIVEKETEFVLVEKEVYQKEVRLFESNYNYHKSYSYRYYKDNSRSFNMEVILLIRK